MSCRCRLCSASAMAAPMRAISAASSGPPREPVLQAFAFDPLGDHVGRARKVARRDEARHVRARERRQDGRLGLEIDQAFVGIPGREMRHLHHQREAGIRAGDAENVAHGAAMDALADAESVDFGAALERRVRRCGSSLRCPARCGRRATWRQAGAPDLLGRRAIVVGHAVEGESRRGFVEQRVGGGRIAVARLADRADQREPAAMARHRNRGAAAPAGTGSCARCAPPK